MNTEYKFNFMQSGTSKPHTTTNILAEVTCPNIIDVHTNIYVPDSMLNTEAGTVYQIFLNNNTSIYKFKNKIADLSQLYPKTPSYEYSPNKYGVFYSGIN